MQYEPGLVQLFNGYSDPSRAYHNWDHIARMLDLWESVHDRLSRPRAVYLAILFHDAVYDPAADDNELRSANLLHECIKDEHIDDMIGADVLILSTRTHTVDNRYETGIRNDCAYFLDMDLSVLGGTHREYDQYADGIRREYAHVSDGHYHRERTRVLERFLERDRIYFTEWAISRWETPARQNIQRELKVLGANLSLQA